MAVLTRIQNNQITDSTINAQYKVLPGSITGNLLATNVTFNSNITILGNLTVANSYTQLNSINTYINDPIVVFNNGYTGSLTGYDMGILINRNLSSLGPYGSVNTAWVWSEADQAFEAIATTETGTSVSSINNSGWANVKIGNTTIVSGTVTNSLSVGTTLGVTGTSTLGVVNTSGVLTSTANVVAASGTSSTNTTTGALVVVGGVGISGALNVGGAMNVSGVVTYSGNLVAASTTTSTSTTTGSIVSLGGIGLAGNVYAGGALMAAAGAVSTGVFSGTYSDGIILDYTTGMGRVSVGASDGLTIYNGGLANTALLTITSAGNVIATGNLVAANTAASTSTTTGSFVAQGGVGIAGATWIGGLINVAGTATLQSTLAVSGITTVGGNLVAAATTSSSNTTTGALVVQGGVGIAGAIYGGSSANFAGNVNLTATNSALTTNQTTAFVFNDTATTLNVGSAATALNLGATSGTATLANPTLVGTQTTQNVYNTVATTVNAFGAATTLGIGAATGTLTIGNPTITATNGTNFNLNGTSPTLATTSTGTVTLFNTNATTVNAFGAATTIAIGNSSGTTTVSGILKSTGNIVAGSGTTSTSTTTGAVVVKGGIGISGDTYIGGNLSVAGTLTYINTTTEIVTGVEIVAGNLVANSGTASTNTTTGALVVQGGAGISGALNIGGGFATAGNIADNGGGLTTTQTTGYLFNENATTLYVGSAATTLSIGATTGTTTLNSQTITYPNGTTFNYNGANPTLATTSTGTLTLFNTNATTVNAFGAATTIAIGNASGTTTIAGITKHSGNLVAASGTTSTSNTTGALVVAGLGGLAVGGNINVGTYGSSVHQIFGNVLIGRGNPATSADTELTINLNTDTPIVSNATVHVSGATGKSAIYGADSFGTGVTSQFYGRRARGTSASPTAAQVGDLLSAFTGKGYGATGYYNSLATQSAGVQVFADENYTDSAQGSYVAISTISRGNVIANVGLRVESNGNVTIPSYTYSTVVGTGALVVNGGMSIGANLVVGADSFHQGVAKFESNVIIESLTPTTSTTTGALILPGSGGLNVGGNAYVGQNMYIGATALSQQANFANPTIIAIDSGSNYAQIALKNTTNTGSADFAAYSDSGTDAGGWVDVGIAGTAFNDGNYTITKPEDGYLITRPTNNTSGGNLIISTSEAGSYNDVVVSVGAFHANAEVARFHGNATTSGYLSIKTGTNSTAATNGAVRITNNGGLGVTGNVFFGNAVTINSTQTTNQDFTVKGVNDSTLIWARPNTTYDQVVIGGSDTVGGLTRGAKLIVNSTDSMLLPTGTTANRPSNSGGTDVTGMFRYNTTLGYIEFFTGTAWQGVTSQFTVITDEQFNGTGSQTIFTLGAASTTAATIVSINGIIQIPTLAYSVSGATLTFTEAPASTDVIDVRRLVTTQSITSIASTNGYMGFVADNAGANITTGTASQTVTTSFEPNGAQVSYIANVSVASANTATTIDTMDTSKYRSSKYIVQVTNGANYQVQEVLVVSNGTTATSVTYGTLQTNGNLGVVQATQSGSNTLIQFIAANATNNVRIKKDYIAI